MTNPSLPLSAVAPAFVTMAHRIVWCSVATIARDDTPRTRVLHPIWEYANDRLTGWITWEDPTPPKGSQSRGGVERPGR